MRGTVLRMRTGVPGDPLHNVLLAIHYELVGDRRNGERRAGERRRECGGIAAAAGLDRRTGADRRDGSDRRRPAGVERAGVRLMRVQLGRAA
jgi:hypothetical protein